MNATTHKRQTPLHLAVAGGFWGVWSILAGFSQDFTQLLILYTIMVGGAMAGHVFLPTVVGDSFEDAKRARVVGWVYGALVGFGALTTPLIGQLANVENGWRYGFFVFGALNILFSRSERHRASSSTPSHIWAIVMRAVRA